MNKSYGLIMSTPMIQAYLNNLKTETRRTKGLKLINKNPDDFKFLGWFKDKKNNRASFMNKYTNQVIQVSLPYGDIGSSLYFKETYCIICKTAVPYCECETEKEKEENHYVEYKADTGNPYPGEWPVEEARGNPEAAKWKSSMFMDKEYSRFQNITTRFIEIQRVQYITNEDAWAEGCPRDIKGFPRDWYYELWDTLNGDKYPVAS
ncbi:MAG TPA: hypothetical protein DIW23_04835, partial [Anaerolineae bacterium]|nr:hypothetical protein [Anaerolineae bacterium]